MYTLDNTEGYTQEQLDKINKKLEQFIGEQRQLYINKDEESLFNSDEAEKEFAYRFSKGMLIVDGVE